MCCRILSISRIGSPFCVVFPLSPGFVPSNGESFPSLGTPSLYHVSPGLGPHSHQEAMRSFSALVVRLECSLHQFTLLDLLEPIN